MLQQAKNLTNILLQAVKHNSGNIKQPLCQLAESISCSRPIFTASKKQFHTTQCVKSGSPNIQTKTSTSEPDGVRPIEDVPGPKAVPLFGTALPQLNNLGRLYDFMNDQAKKFGGIYKEKLGKYYDIVLSDADIVQTFYQREEKLPHRYAIEPWRYWKEKRGKKLGLFLM